MIFSLPPGMMYSALIKNCFMVAARTLQQNRLVNLAELLQKLKVLHVAGADLNDVDIFK